MSVVIITVDALSLGQLALFSVAEKLKVTDAFRSKLLNEAESYQDGIGVFHHDIAEEKEFFRFAGVFLTSRAKRKAIQIAMTTGLFKNHLSKLHSVISTSICRCIRGSQAGRSPANSTIICPKYVRFKMKRMSTPPKDLPSASMRICRWKSNWRLS
jgi:hypothetical protein